MQQTKCMDVSVCVNYKHTPRLNLGSSGSGGIALVVLITMTYGRRRNPRL